MRQRTQCSVESLAKITNELKPPEQNATKPSKGNLNPRWTKTEGEGHGHSRLVSPWQETINYSRNCRKGKSPN